MCSKDNVGTGKRIRQAVKNCRNQLNVLIFRFSLLPTRTCLKSWQGNATSNNSNLLGYIHLPFLAFSKVDVHFPTVLEIILKQKFNEKILFSACACISTKKKWPSNSMHKQITGNVTLLFFMCATKRENFFNCAAVWSFTVEKWRTPKGVILSLPTLLINSHSILYLESHACFSGGTCSLSMHSSIFVLSTTMLSLTLLNNWPQILSGRRNVLQWEER